MNIENLRINEQFYAINKYVGLTKPEIRTFIIKERKEFISSESGNVVIEVMAKCGTLTFWKHYYDYVGQSLVKAERVLEHKIKRYENNAKRRLKENENYAYNKEHIKEAELKYLDKDVMIKWKSFEDNKPRYVKSKITHVSPTYKKGVYAINCRGYNSYLTSRENKNWYFWTREKELIQQRDVINKELAKIRRAAK